MSLSNTTEKVYDVVVVGAGLSGLQAAILIQATGLSVCVLEATDRVGGKTLTIQSCEIGFNDLGAAWINDTNQSEMFKLYQRFGIEPEVQRASGDNIVQLVDGSIQRIPYGQLAANEDVVQRLMDALRTESAKVDLEAPNAWMAARDVDQLTFREWCIQATASAHAVGFADMVTSGLLGVDSAEVSALYMLHYIKSGCGIDNLLSDQKGGGQYLRARQGTQTVSKRMAAELAPRSLFLKTQVTEIDQSRPHGRCEVKTAGGLVFTGRRVIVSIPTTLYDTITFQPPLPNEKQVLSENTVMGYYSKMIYVFKEPWWRHAGFSGIIDAETGPISFSRDTSIPADDQWSITCFIVGERGRQWSKLSKAARHRQVWTQFSQAFGRFVASIPEPINALEREWSKHAFFLGAPCPVMPPGVLTTVGSRLATPFNNVHFVGTETALVWRGYMEGAVRSGQRGAAQVIKELKGRNHSL